MDFIFTQKADSQDYLYLKQRNVVIMQAYIRLEKSSRNKSYMPTTLDI